MDELPPELKYEILYFISPEKLVDLMELRSPDNFLSQVYEDDFFWMKKMKIDFPDFDMTIFSDKNYRDAYLELLDREVEFEFTFEVENNDVMKDLKFYPPNLEEFIPYALYKIEGNILCLTLFEKNPGEIRITESLSAYEKLHREISLFYLNLDDRILDVS